MSRNGWTTFMGDFIRLSVPGLIDSRCPNSVVTESGVILVDLDDEKLLDTISLCFLGFPLASSPAFGAHVEPFSFS